MERLNKENKDPYVGSIIIRNQQVDFYMDDYGQCYYFEFLAKDGSLDEMGCGTYNFNYLEEAISWLDPKGYTVSEEGLEVWNQRMLMRADRELPSIDYDDYQIYDIKAMYKELGEKFEDD